ncbi:MAG TPA: type II toxin-antitoxin system RelE/ParE family toxin [Alphaproteobacteria bacterium]|nr:type II toxin-antitoxin system RelE/ParE family toxin [Alphaproteobacteria bacterium]
MARLRLTRLADSDLKNILSHVGEKAGYGSALDYARHFNDLYDRLARFPDSGAPRPALGDGARIALVLPYVVIYEHNSEEVLILRILHSKQDATRALLAR